MRGDAVAAEAHPIPLHVRSRDSPPAPAPPASSRGNPYGGHISSVTHVCRNLPPPRVFRARHAAGLEPGGQDPRGWQRRSPVNRPGFGDRSVTAILSGPTRLHLRLRPSGHAAGDAGRGRLPQTHGAAAKVHRRKNGLVSHTGKSRIYAAAHDCHGGHARRTCHARSHDRVTRKRRSVVTPARFPGPDTRPGPVTHVSHGRVTRKRRSVVTPARFPGPTRGQDLSRT